MSFQINSIFYSIQGEGPQVGRPAIFVRFAGCNLSCAYCDTAHGMHKEYAAEGDVINAIAQCAAGYRIDPTRTLIVLTGGEPMLQLAKSKLVQAVLRVFQSDTHSSEVAIETNGTIPWKLYGNEKLSLFEQGRLTVVLSPKNGHRVNLRYFDAIKIVISPEDEERAVNKRVLSLFKLHGNSHVPVFLQPNYNQLTASTTNCIRILKTHPEWRLSMQVHKFIGVA